MSEKKIMTADKITNIEKLGKAVKEIANNFGGPHLCDANAGVYRVLEKINELKASMKEQELIIEVKNNRMIIHDGLMIPNVLYYTKFCGDDLMIKKTKDGTLHFYEVSNKDHGKPISEVLKEED